MIQTDTPVGTPAKDGTKLTVLNPTGYPPRVTPKDMAPRLDTLEGKKVYLVDCRFDDADIFLTNFAETAYRHGAEPFVQIEPDHIDIHRIADGSFDSYLRAYAAQVRAWRAGPQSGLVRAERPRDANGWRRGLRPAHHG